MHEEDERAGIGVDLGMEIVERVALVGEGALVRVIGLGEEGRAVIVRSLEHFRDVLGTFVEGDGGEELLLVEEGLRLHYFLIN